METNIDIFGDQPTCERPYTFKNLIVYKKLTFLDITARNSIQAILHLVRDFNFCWDIFYSSYYTIDTACKWQKERCERPRKQDLRYMSQHTS